ncbi:uncharacterized protein RHIMIDRAFT_236656 [Rhizopus microsporus ATCC 52813]|uniref:Endonuclease/exonuclease/phosphatase domain-containing protein n=1 Tax=Rhizopus microsporus ATCC 52813 TaxID=1340429 RepID=A0A2G4SXT7_RHIZD|nr:uncharacterized protein RHIMIDRAFT_236656 [Rhizopus microsporus ATCC 52813]PHZ13603.1 hypothetical protein RHIMIDRAFT_236656 [Rhizopus microsporus ATCC 52813]
MNENSQQATGSSTNFQEPSTGDPPREQIAGLMALQASTQQNNSSQAIANTEFPSLHGATSQNLDGLISQTPWHNPSKVAALKKSMYLNLQKNRVHKEEAAARFFQLPSTNQRFQYLYISTKIRIPAGKLHSYLHNIGVNNARVLDIYYPDRSIAALLIHVDYIAEFKQLLEAKRYKDLTEQERTFKACEIQRQRLQRAVLHIREPVKFAVAYYFYQQKWLPKSFIGQINSSRYGRSEDIVGNFSEDTTINQAIFPLLKIADNSSPLFITETWLLPPNKYLTTWKQFHTYGQPINSTHQRNCGHLGIALLINPTFKQHIYHIQHENPTLAKYTLSVVISAKILIRCLYIPPNLDDNDLSEILELLPPNYNNTIATIICGDFNARMGKYSGDTRKNHKRRLIHNWIQSNELINWN